MGLKGPGENVARPDAASESSGSPVTLLQLGAGPTAGSSSTAAADESARSVQYQFSKAFAKESKKPLYDYQIDFAQSKATCLQCTNWEGPTGVASCPGTKALKVVARKDIRGDCGPNGKMVRASMPDLPPAMTGRPTAAKKESSKDVNPMLAEKPARAKRLLQSARRKEKRTAKRALVAKTRKRQAAKRWKMAQTKVKNAQNFYDASKRMRAEQNVETNRIIKQYRKDSKKGLGFLTQKKFDMAWLKKKASDVAVKTARQRVSRAKAQETIKKEAAAERSKKYKRRLLQAKATAARVKVRKFTFILAQKTQAALEGKSTSQFKKQIEDARGAAKEGREKSFANTASIHKNINQADLIVMERKQKLRKATRAEREAVDEQQTAKNKLVKERTFKGESQLRHAKEKSQKGKAMVIHFKWREDQARQQEQKFDKYLQRRRWNLKTHQPFKESQKSKRRIARKLERLKRRTKREIKRKSKFKLWLVSGQASAKEKRRKYKLAKESVVDATAVKKDTLKELLRAKQGFAKAREHLDTAEDLLAKTASERKVNKHEAREKVLTLKGKLQKRLGAKKTAATRKHYADVMVKERFAKLRDAKAIKVKADADEDARKEVAKEESRGSVMTSQRKSLRKMLRKLDGSTPGATPGAARRRRWVPPSRRRSIKTHGGVPVSRRRTSFLKWQKRPPYTPIPIKVLKKQMATQEKSEKKLPEKKLRKQIHKMAGRRRRAGAIDSAKSRSGVWKALAKEIKTSSKQSVKVAEKRAAQAAKNAIASLSKATGVKMLSPASKAKLRSKTNTPDKRKKSAHGAGKKQRDHNTALSKVLDRTVDATKRKQIRKSKNKSKAATKHAIKRKLASRRRVPAKPAKKPKPLMTTEQVHREVAPYSEYKMAKKGIANSLKHGRKIYPLVDTRRRAYVARRRRTVPSNVKTANTEIDDLTKSINRWQAKYKKSMAAAKKLNPDQQANKKANAQSSASKTATKP